MDKIKDKKKKIKKFFSSLKGRKKTLFVVLFVLVLGLLFLARSWFVVAVVNNQVISRFSFDRELEKQTGKQLLENKIAEMIILQEAKKQKLVIPQEEVEKKIKDIETQLGSQNQNLDQILSSQGQTRSDLKKQINTQFLIEKMLSGNIDISESDIASYFDKSKDSYPKGTTLESKKEEIKNILFQQALGDKFQPWLQGLRQNAKIYYFLKF